jgi:hypothetical protein
MKSGLPLEISHAFQVGYALKNIVISFTVITTSSDPKKGALVFKNLKLKKYSNNLRKLN